MDDDTNFLGLYLSNNAEILMNFPTTFTCDILP